MSILLYTPLKDFYRFFSLISINNFCRFWSIWSPWIRIRIRIFFADPDPDPGCQENADPCRSGSKTLELSMIG